MNVSLAGGPTISAGANNSSSLTLSGTLTQLNAALGSLMYTAPLTDASTTLVITPRDETLVGSALNVAISITGAPAVEPGVTLITDSFDSTKTELLIGGLTSAQTAGTHGEVINVDSAANGQVRVTIDGAAAGTFGPTGHIVFYGSSGSVVVTISHSVLAPVYMVAGSGDAIFRAGGGDAVLVGGSGRNVLTGGLGHNLLIAGSGLSRLLDSSPGVTTASANSSILVGKPTIYDQNDVALNAVLQTWSASGNVDERILKLRNGSNSAGIAFNSGAMVSAGFIDELFAISNNDWLWDIDGIDLISIEKHVRPRLN